MRQGNWEKAAEAEAMAAFARHKRRALARPFAAGFRACAGTPALALEGVRAHATHLSCGFGPRPQAGSSTRKKRSRWLRVSERKTLGATVLTAMGRASAGGNRGARAGSRDRRRDRLDGKHQSQDQPRRSIPVDGRVAALLRPSGEGTERCQALRRSRFAPPSPLGARVGVVLARALGREHRGGGHPSRRDRRR